MLSESERKSVIPLLQDVPLFSSLDKKALNSISEVAGKKTFQSGSVIAKEGDKALSFFLILEGAVEVRRGKKTLARLGRGQFFGEMALFDDEPRSADVAAIEETTCLLLTSWALHGLLTKSPNISGQIIKELVRRLRESDRALSE